MSTFQKFEDRIGPMIVYTDVGALSILNWSWTRVAVHRQILQQVTLKQYRFFRSIFVIPEDVLPLGCLHEKIGLDSALFR